MYIKTDKFKTSLLNINGVIPYEKYLKLKINILLSYLTTVNNNFPTRRLCASEKARLFGLRTSVHSSIKGKNINFSLNFRYLDEEFTDEDYLEDLIKFIDAVLYKPLIKDNSFDKEAFDILIREKKTGLRLYLESPDAIAKDNYQKILFPDIETAQEELLYLDEISVDEIYNLYKALFNKALFRVLCIGKTRINHFVKLDNNLISNISILSSDVLNKEVFDEKEQAQNSLIITYSLENLSTYEKLYVLPIYNDLIGGTASSKLFMKIREEKSYVYGINSGQNIYFDLFIISAGLSSENVVDAKKEIFEIMNNTVFNEEEFLNMKNNKIDNIKSINNCIFKLRNMHNFLLDFNIESVEKYIENFEQVTLEDINNISSKLKLQLVYERGVK